MLDGSACPARSDPQLARDAVGVEPKPGSGAHHHEQVQVVKPAELAASNGSTI
jgi:hypothetical protein